MRDRGDKCGCETRDHGLTMQQIGGVLHRADGRRIHLDTLGIVDKGVLFRACSSSQSRPDDEIVAAAICVDGGDERGQNSIVL